MSAQRARPAGGRLVWLTVALAAACGPRELAVVPGGDRPRPAVAADDVAGSSEPEAAMSPYTVAAEWGGARAKGTVELGKDLGALVGGVRVVSSGARLRVAREVVPSPLQYVSALPVRLGGGFIFLNDVALYHASQFDGALTGVAYFPGGSLLEARPAFDRVLVRSTDGRRWMLRFPGGERVPVEPPGLVEILTRDDGLGLATTDRGRLLATRDAGKSWRDVTADLKDAPSGLVERADALYVTVADSAPARLGPDGRIARVEHLPEEPKVERDPRWRVSEAPLRAALRAGVPAEDPGVAIIATAGDLVRVSLRSGELVSVQRGKLPPDVTCEAVRTSDDAVFVCARRASERLVVSGTLFGKPVRVEQTFPSALAFSASDDGALAYAGPCSGPARDGVVCVRGTSGSWVERSGVGDGGALRALGYVVPRADGGATSLTFSGAEATALDLVTGEARTFTGATLVTAGRVGGRPGLIHRDWSYGPDGVLRGWLGGRAVTLPPTGAPTANVFVGDTALYGTAGPRALGIAPAGRLFQTTDRGATWSEVAPPPSHPTPSSTMHRPISSVQCGDLGCALGGWLRVGYPEDPALPKPLVAHAAPPAEAASFAPPIPVRCEASGAVAGRVLPAAEDSDLGAVTAPKGLNVVATLGRATPHPVRTDEGSDGSESSRRAVVVEVSDPFRMAATYVAPFDPLAVRRTVTLTLADVARALGTGGSTAHDVASNLAVARAVPITPLDPGAPGGLLLTGERLAFWSRAGATRVVLLPEDSPEVVLSAAELSGEELALLRSDGARSLLQRVSASGTLSTVMSWAGPDLTDHYPFIADAVAVGPRGELGVVRFASGLEPASREDPARLLLPHGKVVTLAPWSTLTPADDPACRGDAAGYRATVQLDGWLALDGEPRREGHGTALARVRWGEARVCLEGLELRAGTTAGADRSDTGRQLERWVVHRALPRPLAGYVTIGAGFELRQGARCALH